MYSLTNSCLTLPHYILGKLSMIIFTSAAMYYIFLVNILNGIFFIIRNYDN